MTNPVSIVSQGCLDQSEPCELTPPKEGKLDLGENLCVRLGEHPTCYLKEPKIYLPGVSEKGIAGLWSKDGALVTSQVVPLPLSTPEDKAYWVERLLYEALQLILKDLDHPNYNWYLTELASTWARVKREDKTAAVIGNIHSLKRQAEAWAVVGKETRNLDYFRKALMIVEGTRKVPPYNWTSDHYNSVCEHIAIRMAESGFHEEARKMVEEMIGTEERRRVLNDVEIESARAGDVDFSRLRTLDFLWKCETSGDWILALCDAARVNRDPDIIDVALTCVRRLSPTHFRKERALALVNLGILKGNNALLNEGIELALADKPGQPFAPDIWDDIIARLLETGRFQDAVRFVDRYPVSLCGEADDAMVKISVALSEARQYGESEKVISRIPYPEVRAEARVALALAKGDDAFFEEVLKEVIILPLRPEKEKYLAQLAAGRKSLTLFEELAIPFARQLHDPRLRGEALLEICKNLFEAGFYARAVQLIADIEWRPSKIAALQEAALAIDRLPLPEKPAPSSVPPPAVDWTRNFRQPGKRYIFKRPHFLLPLTGGDLGPTSRSYPKRDGVQPPDKGGARLSLIPLQVTFRPAPRAAPWFGFLASPEVGGELIADEEPDGGYKFSKHKPVGFFRFRGGVSFGWAHDDDFLWPNVNLYGDVEAATDDSLFLGGGADVWTTSGAFPGGYFQFGVDPSSGATQTLMGFRGAYCLFCRK